MNNIDDNLKIGPLQKIDLTLLDTIDKPKKPWGDVFKKIGGAIADGAKAFFENLKELDWDNEWNSSSGNQAYNNYDNLNDNLNDSYPVLEDDFNMDDLGTSVRDSTQQLGVRTQLSRIPESTVKTSQITERLDAINTVVQNDPVLSQDYSGSYLANKYPSGGKPGVFSQANPSIANAHSQKNNPALNTQNGSEVQYQYNPQQSSVSGKSVEFGMNATMDGLSSYNPNSSTNALPQMEQMKRAQQKEFLDAAQTPERARQQYQHRGQQNTVPVTRRFGFVDDWSENGLKYKLSPERKEKLRQEIEAERNNPLNKKSLPKAFYESRYEGKVDLWKKLEAGKVLNDNETKQLFHSIDLYRYENNSESSHYTANMAEQVAKILLAQNMVKRTNTIESGMVIINGMPIDTKLAEYIAEKDIEHFRKTDRRLSQQSLSELVGTLSEPYNQKKIQDLYRESRSSGDPTGEKYFENTSNRLLGNKSFYPPLKTDDLSGLQYLNHGLFGEGQDLMTDIKDINFDESTLWQSFYGLGEFKPDPEKPNNINQVVQQVLNDGQARDVYLPQIKLQTRGKGQNRSLGKVKFEAKGTISLDKKGVILFEGKIYQGNNIEVYTFPKGNRNIEKEIKTIFGKHILPFTLFRTIINGGEIVTVTL